MQLHLTTDDVLSYIEHGVHEDFGLHVVDATSHRQGGVTIEVERCAEHHLPDAADEES